MTMLRRFVGRPRMAGGLCSVAAVVMVVFAVPARGEDEPAEGSGPASKQLLAADGFYRRGYFRRAAEEYATFLKKYPDHGQASAARYGLGLCRYRTGQHAEAAELIAAALKDKKFGPRDEALAVLGYCLLSQQKHDRAVEVFDELLDRHGSSKHAESAALNRAQALYLAGRHEDALSACQAFLKARQDSPHRAGAAFFASLSLLALDRPAEAQKRVSWLLKEFPNSPYGLDAHLLLGRSLRQQGELDAAAKQLRQTVSIAPPSRRPQARYNLGIVLFEAGRYKESAEALSALLKEEDAGRFAAPGRLQLGLALLEAGQIDRARQTLQAVVEKDKDRAARARYGLARCDMDEGKYAGARQALDKLVGERLNPGDAADAYCDRALCAMKLENYEQAAKEFAEFRQRWAKNPRWAEAAYRRAFCLHKLQRHEPSLALCRELLQREDADFARPAKELAAENLLLLERYGEAAKLLGPLGRTAENEADRLGFAYRLGLCAYYTEDYARAAELLGEVVSQVDPDKRPELRDAPFFLGDAQLLLEKYEAAAGSLEKYLARADGDQLEARYKLALARRRSGKLQDAAATFERVLKGPDDSPWVHRALFEYAQLAYYDLAKPGQAAGTLDRLLGAGGDPDSDLRARGLYLRAWIDQEAGSFEEAAKRFARLSADYAEHALAPQAAFHHAYCLRRTGDFDRALDRVEALLKKKLPDGLAFRARHLKGVCLGRLSKHEQAAEVLAALADDPQRCTDAVLLDLAWSLRQTGKPDRAAEVLRRLLKQWPEGELVTDARGQLGEILYAKEEYAQAAEQFEKVLDGDTAGADVRSGARYRLGWCYVRLGKQRKAASAFAAFVREFPKSELVPDALYQAGQAALAVSQLDDARKHFARLAKDYPKHDLAPAALLKLGEAQAESQTFKDSAQTYAAFLQKHPKSKFRYLAWFGLGWAMENQKQYDEARKWYAQVVENHDGETAARAQFQIGECYFAEQNFDRAAGELLKVELVYDYPEWAARGLYEAGRAFEQLQQFDQAARQYRQCIKKYGKSAPAEMARKRLEGLPEGARAG